MIYFDATKGSAGHHSGLLRVSTRLRRELGGEIVEVTWPIRGRSPGTRDWFFTAELFSEAERPGFAAFLESAPFRKAALFHDAIPLRHPHITWPQSVARHPGYMKLLAGFDRVWAVSAASKTELEGFWRWQGVERMPPVEVLALGADFDGSVREATHDAVASPARLLCVGIIEPRKNQVFLLEVCDRLWRGGLRFELHLVGRTNPHFGAATMTRARELARRHRGLLLLHGKVDDVVLAQLYRTARATVMPTIAEGCGLPLLESLWMGVPCVCSDLPVLCENAAGGGCLPVPVNDSGAWADALRGVLTDEALITRLTREAITRTLPTWADVARALKAALAV